MSVVSVHDLVKEYGTRGKRVRAVDGVSFELRSGEILGFLGPNGAGKTTTIHMLLGTLKPTAGRIAYFGKEFQAHRSEVLQQVSFASSYTKLPSRLTIAENLDVYGGLYGLTRAEIRARSEKFLRYFGVWELRDRLTARLSAGQTTRVMLAKAFLAHPSVVLLDEPTASLDPDMAHEVRAFVKQQREEYGVSILYTSHNMDEVTDVCDRVIFLKKGRIAACDTPERLALGCSQSRVELVIDEGRPALERLLALRAIGYEAAGEGICFRLPHHEAGPFLSELGAHGVLCSEINIERPTLEEYFLQLAKED